MDTILEHLQGPVGIGVALVVGFIALFVLRKIMGFIFLIVALAFGGWAAARQFDVAIPYVLPGAATVETAAYEAEDEPAEAATAMPAAVSDGALAAPASTRAITAHAPATASAGGGSQAPESVLAENLMAAELRYNAPDSMTLNMPVDLRLVIDVSGMEDLDSVLEGLPGERRGASADVTRQVTASLYGSGFDIRELKPTRQVIDLERPNSWQWQVTPRLEGQRTLFLEVFAHPDDSNAAARVQIFEDQIDVRVTTISQVLHIAQTAHPVVGAIAAGVSILVAVFSFARRRRRRR